VDRPGTDDDRGIVCDKGDHNQWDDFVMNPDKIPASVEELFIRYLERHPGHISDLIFVLEVKQSRAGGDCETPIPSAR